VQRYERLQLTEEQREELNRCAQSRTLPVGDVFRARLILALAGLRAAATLLLNTGQDLPFVQDFLGHRHVTTAQIYDKRRRSTKESASHNMPI
jgi:integrase